MTIPLRVQQWGEVLQPGTTSDPRLFHADSSDRIRTYPSHLGQGYFQEIPLHDDLTLVILDYTLDRDVAIDGSGAGNILELTFHLDSRTPNQTLFCPDFGWPGFTVLPARQRFFKVELFFQRPNLAALYRNILERLAPPTYRVIAQTVRAIYQSCGYRCYGDSVSSIAQTLDHLHDVRNIDSTTAINADLGQTLHQETLVVQHATTCPFTTPIQSTLENILSCPYHGRTRRTYLKQQATQLVDLRFAAMEERLQDSANADYIYEAGAILRQEFAQPPSVETLARRVGTNRLKFNQGFHQVYGTTPFGYLRDCRLHRACYLLLMTELSVVEVAQAVGYTCRSKFAAAFRKKYSINPKAFQIQVGDRAS